MTVTVLIVDDNGVVRDGLRGMLRNQRDIAIVGEAVNGWDALAKVAQLQPDVVLMDVQMPSMDGIEATRSIKERDPGRRILVLTVHPSFADEARAAGADDFLLKDCARDVLVAAIRRLGLPAAG